MIEISAKLKSMQIIMRLRVFHIVAPFWLVKIIYCNLIMALIKLYCRYILSL